MGFRSRYRYLLFPIVSVFVYVSTIVLLSVSCVLTGYRMWLYLSHPINPSCVASPLFLISSMHFAASGRSLNSSPFDSGMPLFVASVAFTRFRFFMVVVVLCGKWGACLEWQVSVLCYSVFFFCCCFVDSVF